MPSGPIRATMLHICPRLPLLASFTETPSSSILPSENSKAVACISSWSKLTKTGWSLDLRTRQQRGTNGCSWVRRVQSMVRTTSLIQPGDIRWFRFASPDKRRPVIVLGRPEIISSLSQIPVVPLSTHVRGVPWEVVLDKQDGLKSRCAAKPEWVKTVDRATLGPWIATLPATRWDDLRTALLYVLGLDTNR
jgi:mRNA interferase MazF